MRLSRMHARVASLKRQRGFVRLPSFIARWGATRRFRPQDLFRANEPGAHFEAYDPVALGPVRRNLNTYSEQFDSVIWAKTRASVTANATTAPDGTLTADKLVEDTTAALNHYAEQTVTLLQGETCTASVNAKAGERAWICVYVAGPNVGRFFNLSAGVVGSLLTGAPTASAIEPAGNGFYRCSITFTASSSNIVRYYVCTGDASGHIYTGDGASGIYIHGAQTEKASAATPYQRITDWSTEYIAAVGAENIGMWEDSIGTIPVTGIERPVGLWMDWRNGKPQRGPELIPQPLDLSSASWSTLGALSAVTANSFTNVSGAAAGRTIAIGAANRMYAVSVGYTKTNAAVEARATFNGTSVQTASTANSGTLSGVLPGGGVFYLRLSGNDTLTITSISIKEVPGNHATQAGGTSRPILSARVNLFTESEFRNGVSDAPTRGGNVAASTLPGYAGALAFSVPPVGGSWAYKGFGVTAGALYTLSVVVKMDDGGAPAFGNASSTHVSNDFALVLGNSQSFNALGYVVTNLGGGLYRVSLSGAAVASSTNVGLIKNDTNSARTFKVTAYDLRTADDAAKNIPAYQRVNSNTDYATEGFPHYLYFVSDDSLQTPSIDFSTVDKVTVWAAVTKLSDAATAILAELSASSTTDNGAFYLTAPDSATSPKFSQNMRGTSSSAFTSPAGYAAPSSVLLTSLFSLSGPLQNEMRINGAFAAQNAAVVGGGTFGNYPLNIGRRNGSTLPFNGRIYSLTVRGSTTPASEAFIARMNRWAAQLAAITI